MYEKKTFASSDFGGFRWTWRIILNPIAIQHFLITSPNNDGKDLNLPKSKLAYTSKRCANKLF